MASPGLAVVTPRLGLVGGGTPNRCELNVAGRILRSRSSNSGTFRGRRSWLHDPTGLQRGGSKAWRSRRLRALVPSAAGMRIGLTLTPTPGGPDSAACEEVWCGPALPVARRGRVRSVHAERGGSGKRCKWAANKLSLTLSAGSAAVEVHARGLNRFGSTTRAMPASLTFAKYCSLKAGRIANSCCRIPNGGGSSPQAAWDGLARAVPLQGGRPADSFGAE